MQSRRVSEVPLREFVRFVSQVLLNQQDLISLDGLGISENDSLNTTRFRHSEDVNGSRQVERHHFMAHVVNMFLRGLSERRHGSGKNGRNCKHERQTEAVGHNWASLYD